MTVCGNVSTCVCEGQCAHQSVCEVLVHPPELICLPVLVSFLLLNCNCVSFCVVVSARGSQLPGLLEVGQREPFF